MVATLPPGHKNSTNNAKHKSGMWTIKVSTPREKIEDDPQNPEIIKTIRGLGYKLGE